MSYGKYSPESESHSVSARNPMVSSVNKMASGYARSLGKTVIWVSTSHMTNASIIVIRQKYRRNETGDSLLPHQESTKQNHLWVVLTLAPVTVARILIYQYFIEASLIEFKYLLLESYI